ncbi:TetR/AcrR family transcriptional regulator [uncultured Hyphomonas sp.]|uniref:TetR/AcrR family transcriptional regulator n=1 Tax=uncultured Hyphomonas sp. TaxID=225298 RepID=UPI002AABD82D|nr:TetR/AcrR family transcriptional regulator [uncultured Hyphomonas sp.]
MNGTNKTKASPAAAIKAPEGASRAEFRRAAFLEAAQEVFLEQGFEAANMSEIVRRAGGSLATLYSQFGDKEGIFLAMLETRMKEVTATLEVELQAHTPVEEGLRRIGEQFAGKLVEPNSLELYRLIVGMAKKYPSIADTFMKLGPNKVRAGLAAYLQDRAEAGEIPQSDQFETLGSLFLDMVRSPLQSRALLDSSVRPTEDDVRASVDRAVCMFLHGLSGKRQA